jgi:soluble lytic murein transglycosylase-like protein
MCLKKQYPKMRSEWFLKINTECKKYGIENSDVCAIIQSESEWNANAVHPNYHDGELTSFDYSLMQINSCFGVYDEWQENIEKGVYEYSECLKKEKGDKPTANRYYNAGRNSKPETYKNWQYVKNIDKDRNTSMKIKTTFFVEK